MVMQKRTDAHFQEMTENDDSAPYAVQGDKSAQPYPILSNLNPNGFNSKETKGS
jgi:hypothetical protein